MGNPGKVGKTRGNCGKIGKTWGKLWGFWKKGFLMGRVENDENSVEIGWKTTELVSKTMENAAIDVKETLAI